jgi:ankyrin repeat protein
MVKNLERWYNKDFEASPLHVVCYNGHEEVVQLFLDEKVDAEMVVGNSGTPLDIAAQRGHASVIRLLLEAGVKIEKRSGANGTAIYKAARSGNVESVSFLLSADAVVFDRNRKINAIVGAHERIQEPMIRSASTLIS